MRVRSREPAEPELRALVERDGPRDECGVFGVYAPEHDVARLAYFALYALQHRGQESAGIATCEGGHITTQRDLGLVSQVFDERSLQALTGEMAIGHVRYSTTGAQRLGELPARLPPRPPPGRARAQRQPHQRGRAAQRADRRGRPLPLHLRLGDHRRADRLAPGRADRGRRRRRDAAPRGRLLDRRHDRATAWSPSATRPACARSASGQLERSLRGRLRELRARHHRRQAAARGPARRAGLDRRARPRDPPGGRVRPSRALRLRAHLLLAARTRSSRAARFSPSAAGWARSSPARRPSRPIS